VRTVASRVLSVAMLNSLVWPTACRSRCSQDILFFWVARMAMMCTELTGTSPFRVGIPLERLTPAPLVLC
jgi:hypothetical protein